MGVDEAIRLRRSVRGFLRREVPEAILREVFTLAQCAPSNCNVQPWVPHVVSGDKLKRLREALVAAGMRDEPIKPDWPADGKFTGIYRERQVGAAQALYGAMGVARGDAIGRKLAYIRNHAFFDAPHAVFIFMPEPFDTREATDLGMYAQTLMLALTASPPARRARSACFPISFASSSEYPAATNCCSASRLATRTTRSGPIRRASIAQTSMTSCAFIAEKHCSRRLRLDRTARWLSHRRNGGNRPGALRRRVARRSRR